MTMPLIKMVRKTYKNQDGKWVLSDTKTEYVTDGFVDTYVGSRQYTRNLGGKVSLRNTYTPIGYKTNRITTISPTGSLKFVATFDYSRC